MRTTRGSLMLSASWVALALAPACGDDGNPAAPDATGSDVADTSQASDTAVAPDTSDAAESDSAAPPDVVEPDPRQLFEGLWKLDGLDPTLPDDDLAPLWGLVLDADYVGLGESVHTSGGFYATKERLIRDLVANHGVRVFGMETPRTAARHLDDWIHGDACDADALSVFGPPDYPIFGVFVDDHTVALFRWLCEWNAAHPDDDVRFFGFDAQQPVDDLAELTVFLEAHDADHAEASLASLATCRNTYDATTEFLEADYEACIAAIDALERDLDQHVVATLEPRQQVELERLLTSYRSWQPEVFYFTTNGSKSYEVRDVAMADIFDATVGLDYAGERIIVWAHNYHLSADHTNIATSSTPHVKTIGSELRARHGAAYKAVAITAHDPQINWPGIANDIHYGTKSTSIEQTLYENTEDAVLLYDPDSQWAPPDVEWFLSEEKMIMRDNYDAIVFLRESPPMNALLWAPQD